MMNINSKYIKLTIEGKMTEDQLKLVFQSIAQLPSGLTKSLVIGTIVSESTKEFTCNIDTADPALALAEKCAEVIQLITKKDRFDQP